jgi:hypothetical protein
LDTTIDVEVTQVAQVSANVDEIKKIKLQVTRVVLPPNSRSERWAQPQTSRVSLEPTAIYHLASPEYSVFV